MDSGSISLQIVLEQRSATACQTAAAVSYGFAAGTGEAYLVHRVDGLSGWKVLAATPEGDKRRGSGECFYLMVIGRAGAFLQEKTNRLPPADRAFDMYRSLCFADAIPRDRRSRARFSQHREADQGQLITDEQGLRFYC